MIFQKSLPCRRRWLFRPYPVFVYSGFRNINAEFPQLPDNPGRTPAGIGCRYLADQCPDFFGYRRSTRPTLLTQLSPMITKSFPLPGNHDPGLNKDQCAPPTRPAARDPEPEQAVCRVNPGTQGDSPVDTELMSQRDDLELQGSPRPKQDGEKCKQRTDNRRHASEFTSAARMRGNPDWRLHGKRSRISSCTYFQEGQVSVPGP